MAAYDLYPHSPQVPDLASGQHHGPGPITPVHSPHHSVHSSASLRTPLHTLTIHEYRKQQGTPLSRIATSSGRTLRRKAAASALNEIAQVSSTRPALHRDLPPSPRPLHSSYSAHQLAPQSQSFDVQTLSNQVLRSQSAEPRAQGGSISSIATVDSQEKARQFGSRKRLPHPPAPAGSGLHPQSYAPVRPTSFIRATLPAPLSFLTEEASLSSAQNTPTPSTFSLSRFPKPPHFETLREAEREKAVSLATTAPATPPTTPAIIHYHGASFDLVNPHASLQYHDIVTPSREFDSSELLPLRSAQEPLLSVSEMVPKRPLYGDLNAAHAGIVRRAEDFFGSSILDLPLPPTPAAISPSSSTYTSPIYSSESHFAPSPLAVKKAPNESRFSIKQLTRALTKRLTKPQEHGQEEEMQQFRGDNTSGLSISVDREPLHPLEQTYLPMDKSSYFPISPISPTSPTSPASLHDFGSISGDEDNDIEYARGESNRKYDLQDLASMVPDDLSTQVGRAENLRSSVHATINQAGIPYNNDLASIYASSSVYTEDDRRKSAHQQSLSGTRQSNPFLGYSGINTAGIANEYSYSHLGKSSHPVSRPLTQELYHRSVVPGDGKTDTISKLIDQYDPGNTTMNSLSTQNLESANTSSLIGPYISDANEISFKDMPWQAPLIPGSSQFEFDLGLTGEAKDTANVSDDAQPTFTRDYVLNRQPGVPPAAPAPLAPAFQYDQLPYARPCPDFSEMFSNGSQTSYGDTRNLLQLPQSEASRHHMFRRGLQSSSLCSQPETKVFEPSSSSSSYSQPEDRASPQTPQEALDQAELIFDKAANQREHSGEDIPAMWERRSSVNLRRGKRLTEGSRPTVDAERPDWETVATDDQQGRQSLDSIADYSSSSEGSRNSLGLTAERSFPSWTKQEHTRGPSNYSHPSPLQAHAHPFSPSSPQLAACSSSQTAPDISAADTPSRPSASTAPVFRFSTQPRHAVDEPYAFVPWADPYALSDKETQELLASGPNDDILIDGEVNSQSRRVSYKFESHKRMLESNSPRSVDTDAGVERENTFDKYTVLGLKGNLTGTPRGTGMHNASSNTADSSSLGAKVSSPCSPRTDYDGFYASPFPATGSVTRIRQSHYATYKQHERTPSQVTLFPSAYNMKLVQECSPLAGSDCRRSLRYPTTFKPARRTSRAAVSGQTKLRQMVLAPDARTTVSSQDTHFSRFMSVSGRPSTSDTATPLHPTHPSLDTFPTVRSGKTILAQQHSPHLVCLEREAQEEDEIRRRKLSWLIFACFCILPPCMFLYRMWGDLIIVSVTKGELGHCTTKAKRVALIAGVVVNIGLVTAILVPILVAQALRAI